MGESKRDTHRTSDGYLTVRALKKGEVDTVSWKVGSDVHVVRLSLHRARPYPALYQVEHTIIHHVQTDSPFTEANRELFDDVRLARNKLHKLRRTAPNTYDTEEKP